ncbi:MAG: DUF3237 domain-containing protein [Desulfobacteraceae bacterium]|jgi:hypothetical protein|nr:DUF3237 domain-containing protein [Desulfobacteraceae bacterium]
MTQDTQPAAPPPLRFLYRSVVIVAEPLSVGRIAAGERRIINITGGSFSGPHLSGVILPGGADWQIIRSDGITEVEARYTLQTHDGALIYVVNRGLRHGPEDVMARLAAGEQVDPSLYYFRTTPEFETGSPEYSWLNGVVAVAVGERQASEVVITVYQVT